MGRQVNMRKRLEPYQAKRDFTRSGEPSGDADRAIRPSEYRRFVVQKHAATRLHYDLRLELDGTFRSWAVTRGPSLDPGEKRLAAEVEDHPLEYGDFEGTIPQGEYGGGTVMIWDRGFWAPETATPPEHSLQNGELKFVLAGSKLKGSFVLVRLKPRAGGRVANWLLIKHRDPWATAGSDDLLAADRSVASGRSMAMIAAGKGKAPKPFMANSRTVPGSGAGPATVWSAAGSRRAAGRSATAHPAQAPFKPLAMPRLTNPDRVLWPDAGLTKRDLADYLLKVAPWMIDHLHGRPCSLLRAPDGIAGEIFFQRHALPGQPSAIRTVTVDRAHAPYLMIDDAQTLVTLVQLSVIEFHPWNCAPGQPTVPGRLVFDLDPAPDVPFDTVVAAALELRERLDRLGLAPFCKTTGGNGLHVVTPLTADAGVTWEQAKLFAQTLCAQMAADSPEEYVTTMSKRIRAGRIYLDHLRNTLMATAVGPLSPRARPGATVSMPLNWRQVRNGLDPKRFTIRTAPALVAKTQPWRDYANSARPLAKAIRSLIGPSV